METQRLLLVVALALILFMIWDAWEKYQNPPPPTSQTIAGEAKPSATTGGERRAGSTHRRASVW